jgi:hypothetical protein
MRLTRKKIILFIVSVCISFPLVFAQTNTSCISQLHAFDSVLSKPLSKNNPTKMADAKKYLAAFIACDNGGTASVGAQKKLKALEGYFDANIAGKNKGGWAQLKNFRYILVDAHLQEIPSNFSNYSSVQEFNNGLALVVVKEGVCEGRNCFIDEFGNIKIDCKHYYPSSFANGFAKAENKGKYGFINTEGRLAIPCKYDLVNNFSENYAVVAAGGKYGFVNIYGEEIIPLQYSFGGDFKDGLAKIVRDGKTGFINTRGNEIITASYDDAANNFSDSLAWVKKAGKWGFVNKAGALPIPLVYDRANNFSEGLACVIKDGKCGYIDRNNEVVVPLIYEPNSIMPDFAGGVAYVIQDGKAFFIDKKGRKVREAK